MCLRLALASARFCLPSPGFGSRARARTHASARIRWLFIQNEIESKTNLPHIYTAIRACVYLVAGVHQAKRAHAVSLPRRRVRVRAGEKLGK